MSANVNQLEQLSKLDLKGTIVQIQKLKTNRFTGELRIRSADLKFCFSFVLRLGRLIWASSDADPQKYWERRLRREKLDLPKEWLATISDEQKPFDSSTELAELLIEGDIDRHQLTEALTTVATEVFFDLIQVSKTYSENFTIQAVEGGMAGTPGGLGSTSDELDTDSGASRSSIMLPLLEIDALLKVAINEWQEWQANCSANFSPNLFPVVQKYELLTALPDQSPEKKMLSMLDGTKTIRDLASQGNYPLLSFARSLMFHLQSGLIGLSKVPRQVSSFAAPTAPKKGIMVACIDDSPLVYQSLKKILDAEGYDCYGVQEPLTIMTKLIKNKPDFIFLDLLMPIVNGYEVCGQIRKTPSLKDIPVVILTGKDGLVDRMRSKLVGATDFMSKPVSNDAVLKVLSKYLTIRN
jgi:two-component system, chemotaxis family, response regulator PixG